ncbi:MAG: hypothetical protein KC635_19985, partial [Myxococcales bacterium]|nr:hypothetical protein [Myxococcales bacterium]
MPGRPELRRGDRAVQGGRGRTRAHRRLLHGERAVRERDVRHDAAERLLHRDLRDVPGGGDLRRREVREGVREHERLPLPLRVPRGRVQPGVHGGRGVRERHDLRHVDGRVRRGRGGRERAGLQDAVAPDHELRVERAHVRRADRGDLGGRARERPPGHAHGDPDPHGARRRQALRHPGPGDLEAHVPAVARDVHGDVPERAEREPRAGDLQGDVRARVGHGERRHPRVRRDRGRVPGDAGAARRVLLPRRAAGDLGVDGAERLALPAGGERDPRDLREARGDARDADVHGSAGRGAAGRRHGRRREQRAVAGLQARDPRRDAPVLLRRRDPRRRGRLHHPRRGGRDPGAAGARGRPALGGRGDAEGRDRPAGARRAGDGARGGALPRALPHDRGDGDVVRSAPGHAAVPVVEGLELGRLRVVRGVRGLGERQLHVLGGVRERAHDLGGAGARRAPEPADPLSAGRSPAARARREAKDGSKAHSHRGVGRGPRRRTRAGRRSGRGRGRPRRGHAALRLRARADRRRLGEGRAAGGGGGAADGGGGRRGRGDRAVAGHVEPRALPDAGGDGVPARAGDGSGAAGGDPRQGGDRVGGGREGGRGARARAAPRGSGREAPRGRGAGAAALRGARGRDVPAGAGGARAGAVGEGGAQGGRDRGGHAARAAGRREEGGAVGGDADRRAAREGGAALSGGAGRRPQIAVIGAGDAPEAALRDAEELGRRLVDAGCRVVCGGLGGVMAAVARGARSSPRASGSDVVGILPTTDAGAANGWVDVVVPTGLGHARN